MPRLAIDYSNTVMYKIVCKDLNINDLYVGHTTDFTRRKTMHKSRCINKDSKIYNLIRANGGWNNWEMLEIEKYNCNDANEARKRERYWYEKLNATLNTLCPCRYLEEQAELRSQYRIEYYENNKEKEQIKQKEYNENNKEKLHEYVKQWYSDNKETVKNKSKQYYTDNNNIIKEKLIQYRIDNKEKIKENKLKYCITNKDKIIQSSKIWYNKKYMCDCGYQLKQGNKSRHLKSKKHFEMLENLKINI